MSIRALITFRTQRELSTAHCATVSGLVAHLFHDPNTLPSNSPSGIDPLDSFTATSIEDTLSIEFDPAKDYLYRVHAAPLYWSPQYTRGNFSEQLDWMVAISTLVPSTSIFYYRGDDDSTPWQPILPSDFDRLRAQYFASFRKYLPHPLALEFQ